MGRVEGKPRRECCHGSQEGCRQLGRATETSRQMKRSVCRPLPGAAPGGCSQSRSRGQQAEAAWLGVCGTRPGRQRPTDAVQGRSHGAEGRGVGRGVQSLLLKIQDFCNFVRDSPLPIWKKFRPTFPFFFLPFVFPLPPPISSHPSLPPSSL